MTNQEVINPLIPTSTPVKVKTIFSKEIIKGYKENLNIDVSNYFKGIDNVEVYKCPTTNYQFYYPFTLAGNSSLYEELQKFPWYYMDWKWEYEEVYKALGKDDKVLEIGCGKGAFLSKLRAANIENVGLELNEQLEGKDNDLDIRVEAIHEHSSHFPEYYDVVCSFQVIEHIPLVGEAIEKSLKCLKKGGTLFISVPDNGTFIQYDKGNVLNMPPHHMGLWNPRSLKNLQNIYSITLEEIIQEPLQKYH